MEYTKKQILRNMLLVVIGSLISSTGFVMFFEPAGINCGGISGVAMLIKYVAKHPLITIGSVSAIINIPLFLLGFKKIGKYFFFGSMLGMAASALGFDLLGKVVPIPEVEPLIAVIFGAAIIGVGLGIVFLAGASTGGVDILARLLKFKFRNCPIGKLILVFDMGTAIATGIVYQDFNNTLYSALALFLSSVVLDYVIYSLDYAKVAFIITDKYAEVSKAISKDVDRGITLLNGRGYYKQEDKLILLCAVKKKQLAELKEVIYRVDPTAFVILQDAQQVLGVGFKRYDRFEL
ncbi:MAG: YitT family protein [Oscillospiraceae bacterium]|nr:YitT family protein [Oscillospiraceae bacterium]